MRMLAWRLSHETEGAVISAELMLVGTILVIGMIVGLKSVRDAVVTELADVADAMTSASQNFSWNNSWGGGWGGQGGGWSGGGGDWGGGAGGGQCIYTCAGAGQEA